MPERTSFPWIAAITLLLSLSAASCRGAAENGGPSGGANGGIVRTTDAGVEENCTPAPASGNRPGVKAVNTVCPIVDADGADESVTAVWRGKTIAFCCPTCVRKFDRMSDAERDAVLVKATTYATP